MKPVAAPLARKLPGTILVCVFMLALGLALDARSELPGQVAIGAAMWAAMLALLKRCASVSERHMLMACLALATAGELVFSLLFGLYTYRLGNIPLFVPPGHVLLFVLGIALAQRLGERAARVVLGCAGLYAALAAAAGFDALSAVLALVIAAVWIAGPQHRRLYAATFALSLLLELYGTWLGVWRWAPEVPGTALATTNPPGAVGAFYCALDALVMTATLCVLPRLRRGAAALRAA